MTVSQLILQEVNMKNLVALPCICVDIFDGTTVIRPGGEALNFAVHASSFNEINTILLGPIGQDSYAKCIMDSIAEKKIDTTHLRIENNMRTANNRTYLSAEGDRYYKEDSWDGEILDKFRLNKDELNIVANSDVVFTYFGVSCFDQIIHEKKKGNFKLAVDFDVVRNISEVEKYAPYIDYSLMSGDESIVCEIEKISKKHDGLFNITMAERGSVTFCRGKRYRVPAKDVKEVVDSTGCGDSYHAGFVCSHVINGDVIKAMNVGSELAAETLGHYGGF